MPRRAAPNPANNRTDLPGKVPIQTAPGQTYGAQTAQQQSQKILPLAAPEAGGQAGAPGGAPPSAGAPPAAPGGPPAPPGFTGMPAPGSVQFPQKILPGGHPGPAGLVTPPNQLGPLGQQAQALSTSEAPTLGVMLRGLAARPGASTIVKSLAQVASGR